MVVSKKSCEFCQLLARQTRNSSKNCGLFSFKDIGDVLQGLLCDIYQPKYVKEPYKNVDVVQTLKETV